MISMFYNLRVPILSSQVSNKHEKSLISDKKVITAQLLQARDPFHCVSQTRKPNVTCKLTTTNLLQNILNYYIE